MVLKFLTLYWCLAVTVNALNFLVFLPGTFRHEKTTLERIAQYLAYKNHGVITLTVGIIPEVKYLVMPKLHLVKEMKLKLDLGKETYGPLQEMGNNINWTAPYDGNSYEKPYWRPNVKACQSLLDSDTIVKLGKERLDLAIVYVGQPCHLAIVEMLNVPFVYYDTRGFSDDIDLASSNLPLHAGLIPASHSAYEPGAMSYIQRLHNTVQLFQGYISHLNITWLHRFSESYQQLDGPVTDAFRSDMAVQKSRGNGPFPDVNEIKRRAELYLVNSDPILEATVGRSAPSNLIYVGGAHIEFPKPLFSPWNDTIALPRAKNGVIVVSFGEMVNASTMPLEMAQAFVNLFRHLEGYQIFVRIGSETLHGLSLPSHVNLTMHLPQLDLLGSDKARLLISHGGMNSIMEALYCGVPVLGIPMIGLNYQNLWKAQRVGIAKILDRNALIGDSLLANVQELLKPKYLQRARELSQVIRDRPMNAFESTIFWLEHVARHHGAKLSFSQASRRLTALQFTSLGVALTMIGVTLLTIYVVLRCVFGFVYHLRRAGEERLAKLEAQQRSRRERPVRNGYSGDSDHLSANGELRLRNTSNGQKATNGTHGGAKVKAN